MGTHFRGLSANQLALDTFIKLVRAAESFVSRTSSEYDKEGLTTSQFGVLEALFHLGPLCQKELASKILKSSGNMTLVIDNLEKRSLVRRTRDAEDRRYYRIHLTDQGRDLMTSLFPRHAQRIREEMASLSPAEQAELGRLCKILGRAQTPPMR